jgi:hypothetical protein
MPPRHSGTNGGGRSKFIKTEALPGEEFVLGVKLLRPPARIVFERLEVEVIDILAHLAVEAASLVMLWAPDDENPTPERPMGLDPQKTLTECHEACDVQNGVGIQIVKLNPVSKMETLEERMQGKREPLEKECEEKYPESWRWPGYDLRTSGENFRRIIFQQADLLGTRQLSVSTLGLDPIPNSGRVSVGGLGLLHGGTASGTGRDRAPLAHDDGAQQELHASGRKERCVLGAERKEEDDGGGVG